MTSNKDELPDNRMIQNNLGKDPLPAWLYGALLAIVAALLWGGGNWVYQRQHTVQEATPFLQVTNRQFSIFLWQFPEYMRANVSAKTGYLPGFQYVDKMSIEPGKADEYVVAPPEVLFLYHTWKRLIGNEFVERPIAAREFREFLEYSPEWKPLNWKAAPEGYRNALQGIEQADPDLKLTSIPKEVQQAFIGWKNFLMEGELINKLKPTFGEVADFLRSYRHYARNYWRNIVKKGKPDYLRTISSGNFDEKARVPDSEMAAFLRVAIFNYQQAKKNL